MAVGEAGLQQILGSPSFRLLIAIDERLISIGRLTDLVIERYGDTIFDNENVLNYVIPALREEDARQLAIQLDGSAKGDVYQQLRTSRFSINSPDLEVLYKFFELSPPDRSQKINLDPNREVIAPEYGLYAYQKDVVDRAFRKLISGDRRVLLHMPTGAGKTRTAMVLVSEFLKQSAERDVVVWLAHSEELCQQAASEFSKCWSSHGLSRGSLGRFFGSYGVDLASFSSGLLVGGLQKMSSRSGIDQESFLRLKRRVGLVVMDEAHQATAPTYKHILDMLAPQGGPTSILGLSATPGRSSIYIDETQELARLFCRNKETIMVDGYDNPLSFLQDEGYLSKPEFEYLNHKPGITLSKDDLEKLREGFDLPDQVVSRLAEDECRNLLIADRILKLAADPNNKIIVFAASVQHSLLLSDVLRLKGVRVASVSALDSREQRAIRIKRFKSSGDDALQVLINYGVLTTGFDAPRTNVAVITRPTRSVVLYSQMIGRAMRGPRSGGNETCRVVTVVDDIEGFETIYDGFRYWDDLW